MMKRTLHALVIGVVMGTLVAGSAYGAQACTGQWCDEGDAGWWYKLDYEGSVFLANTWYWIEDEDGAIRCYCFDYNGWLITDPALVDEPIDSDGRWLDESGNVVTRSADEVEYAHSTRFTAPESSQTASTSASGSGTVTATHIQAAGDIPTEGGSAPYQQASVAGGTVTNTWAGYTMTLPFSVTSSTANDGTDWYVTGNEQESIYSVFYRLDIFKAGNTDLNAFASSVLSSAKVLSGDKAVGTETVSINGFSFIKVTKAKYLPTGTAYNYAFIRQMPGTNYAQVITFETVDGSDYSSCMSTYTAI